MKPQTNWRPLIAGVIDIAAFFPAVARTRPAAPPGAAANAAPADAHRSRAAAALCGGADHQWRAAGAEPAGLLGGDAQDAGDASSDRADDRQDPRTGRDRSQGAGRAGAEEQPEPQPEADRRMG